MKCEKCNKEIPESVGECVHCNSGIRGIRGYSSSTDVFRISGIREIPTKIKGGYE